MRTLPLPLLLAAALASGSIVVVAGPLSSCWARQANAARLRRAAPSPVCAACKAGRQQSTGGGGRSVPPVPSACHHQGSRCMCAWRAGRRCSAFATWRKGCSTYKWHACIPCRGAVLQRICMRAKSVCQCVWHRNLTCRSRITHMAHTSSARRRRSMPRSHATPAHLWRMACTHLHGACSGSCSEAPPCAASGRRMAPSAAAHGAQEAGWCPYSRWRQRCDRCRCRSTAPENPTRGDYCERCGGDVPVAERVCMASGQPAGKLVCAWWRLVGASGRCRSAGRGERERQVSGSALVLLWCEYSTVWHARDDALVMQRGRLPWRWQCARQHHDAVVTVWSASREGPEPHTWHCSRATITKRLQCRTPVASSHISGPASRGAPGNMRPHVGARTCSCTRMWQGRVNGVGNCGVGGCRRPTHTHCQLQIWVKWCVLLHAQYTGLVCLRTHCTRLPAHSACIAA